MEQTQKLKQAVKEYKAGKVEAFTFLYEESKKYIYTIIYSIMRGNNNALDDTEEIMNDTYLEISQKISQLREDEKFLSWAKAIATSKALYYIKKNQKYVLLSEDDDTIESLADSDDIIPEEVMMNIEKRRLVRDIINTELTQMQKLCVTCVYFNDMKQSEIAQELDIPENTVKTHLYRAKAKIQAGVEDLAKNKNTKLYSVAPLMLLLFQEEVKEAVVPQHISVSVLSAVSGTAGTTVAGVATAGVATGTATGATTGATTAGATTTGIKGVLAKIAGASLKAKLIGTVATVAMVAFIGGVAYVASQDDESGKNTYDDSMTNFEEEKFDENNSDNNMVGQENIGPEEQETESVEDEKEVFRILAQHFTSTGAKENLSGKELVPNAENVCEFICNVAEKNHDYEGYPYDKYLPQRADRDGVEEAYTLESIQEYVKSVFGIEINSVDYWLMTEEDGCYVTFTTGGEAPPTNCEITNVDDDGDVCTVQGTYKGIYAYYSLSDDEIVYEDRGPYNFTMSLTKNEESPLGFTLIKISYE